MCSSPPLREHRKCETMQRLHAGFNSKLFLSAARRLSSPAAARRITYPLRYDIYNSGKLQLSPLLLTNTLISAAHTCWRTCMLTLMHEDASSHFNERPSVGLRCADMYWETTEKYLINRYFPRSVLSRFYFTAVFEVIRTIDNSVTDNSQESKEQESKDTMYIQVMKI